MTPSRPAPSRPVRTPVIGVMGGHDVDAATYDLAKRVGTAIAQAGWHLLTGGRNEGVMAAATDAARAAGGFTIGIHPGHRDDASQADADLMIYTGIGYARNMVNVLSSDVLLVLPGSHGTLSEAAFAQTFGVPTVLLGFNDGGLFPQARVARDVDDAVTEIQAVLAAR